MDRSLVWEGLFIIKNNLKRGQKVTSPAAQLTNTFQGHNKTFTFKRLTPRQLTWD